MAVIISRSNIDAEQVLKELLPSASVACADAYSNPRCLAGPIAARPLSACLADDDGIEPERHLIVDC